MHTTKFGNQVVTLGLDWHSLDGEYELRTAANKIARKEKRSLGVIAKSGLAAMVGLADRGAGGVAAAQWLSLACQKSDLILVQPIEEGNFWICAIQSGLPVPTFDLVTDQAGAIEKVRELRELRKAVTVYAPAGMFAGAVEGSFESLVANCPDKPTKIGKVTKSAAGPLLLLVVILAAAGGGYYYVDKKRSIARQRSLIEQAQKDAQDVLGEKRKILEKQKAAYDSALEALNRDIASPEPRSLVTSWISAIEAVPVAEAGWLLISAECASNSCTASFQRDTFGTMRSFATWANQQGWGGSTKIEPELALVAIPASSVPTRANNKLEGMTAWGTIRPAVISRLQEVTPAGPRFDFAKAEEPQVFLARKPGTKEDLGPPLKLPAAFGKWTLSGRYLHEPRELAQLINEPNIIVDTLSLRMQKSAIEWRMEGRYVAN